MNTTKPLTRYDLAEQVRAKLRYTPKDLEPPATTILTAKLNDHSVQITLAYKASEADLLRIMKSTKDLENTLRTLDIPAKPRALERAQHDATNRIKYMAQAVQPVTPYAQRLEPDTDETNEEN